RRLRARRSASPSFWRGCSSCCFSCFSSSALLRRAAWSASRRPLRSARPSDARLIQWRASGSRDPPLNFRAPSRFLILFFAATLAISSAFAAALSSQAAPSPALTILSKEGRRSIPIATVGDHELVALDDLSSIFQLTTREDALGAITVSYKGKTI